MGYAFLFTLIEDSLEEPVDKSLVFTTGRADNIKLDFVVDGNVTGDAGFLVLRHVLVWVSKELVICSVVRHE